METHSSPTAAADRASPLSGSADSATDAVAALHPSLSGERAAERLRSWVIAISLTLMCVAILATAIDRYLDGAL